MFGRSKVTRVDAGAAAVTVLLVAGFPAHLSGQVLGRQQHLRPQEIQTLQTSIRELGGRAVIGFKPSNAPQGVNAEGVSGLSPLQVGALADSVLQTGIEITRRYQLIPAVAARIDPTRLADLLANPAIDYVAPDIPHQPTEIGPTSPGLPGAAQTIPWGIVRIAAPDAWSVTRGAPAKLGIIDTGIDDGHPDLHVTAGINLVTGGTGRSDWNENRGPCTAHGTHVAGIASALDNGIGVVGVAPDAALYSLRVFDTSQRGTTKCYAFASDVVAALQYAVQNDLDVVNMSLEAAYPSLPEGDAIRAAFFGGVVVVASAGNGGGPVAYPAAFPYAIAVAALDDRDILALFSDRGPDIDVAGPGVEILSTWENAGTTVLDGTSMASAHVAGVAALVRAASPGLSSSEVRELIRSTAREIALTDCDCLTGYGIVDAAVAAAAAGGGGMAVAPVPGLLNLTAEPGGSPVSAEVEIRSVGAPGVIHWSATSDPSASWLAASTPDGRSSAASSGRVTLTADPGGLAPGIHRGVVTVQAETPGVVNSPVEIRVRLAVAPRVTVDRGSATAGEIMPRGRLRFLLDGTSGQRVDVAVLPDPRSPEPLGDPNVRLYAPDGETLLAFNDNAEVGVGLSHGALLLGTQLPEDGDYIVEVASSQIGVGGGFIVKAREAGPVLAVSTEEVNLRAEQGRAASASDFITVFNLTGIGVLDFSVTTSNDRWLSVETSGEADYTLIDRVPAHQPAAWEYTRQNVMRTGSSPAADRGGAAVVPPGGRDPTPLEAAAGYTVAVTADPTGRPAGDLAGAVTVTSADRWLPPVEIPVHFRVYTPGMQVIAEGRAAPWGVAPDSTDTVVGATFDDGGSLVRLAPKGPPGPSLASAMGQPLGIARGADGSWFAGTFDSEGAIVRVQPDGQVSPFAHLPISRAAYLAAGPGGELYATGWCGDGRVHRVSVDGTRVEPIGRQIGCPSGIAYNPLDNNLYVASWQGGGIHRIGLDGVPHGALAPNVAEPVDLAIGRSGSIYVADRRGRLWTVDAVAGGPAELLALTPSNPWGGMGLGMVDGALVMSGYPFGEFYSFPVADCPIEFCGPRVTVRLVDDGVADANHGNIPLPDKPFLLPIAVQADATRVTRYALEVEWNPSSMTLLGISPGDFSSPAGSFSFDTRLAAEGRASVAGAEPEGTDAATLFTLQFVFNRPIAAGDVTELSIDVTELGQTPQPDGIGQLLEEPARICGSSYVMGDVTLDERISSADAVQVLRRDAGLPLAPHTDIRRGDVSGDGAILADDAGSILRSLVGLPIDSSSILGVAPLECRDVTQRLFDTGSER